MTSLMTMTPLPSQYLREQYQPRFDAVLSVCWERCSAVTSGMMDPLSPSYPPPLLKPECLLLVLLTNACQMNSKLVSAQDSMMTGLYRPSPSPVGHLTARADEGFERSHPVFWCLQTPNPCLLVGLARPLHLSLSLSPSSFSFLPHSFSLLLLSVGYMQPCVGC